MSKLEELIARLCPDGVEYKKLCDCVKPVSNINWNKTKDLYQYIDLSSVDRDNHCILETQVINADNAPSRAKQIILKDDVLVGTTRPLLKRYCMIQDDYDNNICSTGFCVLRAEQSIVLPRWIYHNVSSNDFFAHVELFQKGASYPAISDKELKEYKLPVPPLEVQREIVHILDSFTLLTAELTAELAARQKQYEFYRDMLLTFDDVRAGGTTSRSLKQALFENSRNIVEYKATKDLTVDSFWLMPSTPKFLESGIKYITSKNIKNGKIEYDTAKFISEDDYNKISSNRAIQRNDLLITMIGTIGEAAFVDTDEPFYGQNLYLLRLNPQIINRKYYFYFITQSKIKNSLVSKKNASSQGYIKAGSIENLVVPVPPLSEQQRIVDILDRFDALCNDITSGLPAEIEARRKQYEYYRDKLLTFKELKKEA